MNTESNQIFLKHKQIHKDQLAELGSKLEELCESKPTVFKGECLFVHPTSLEPKNFLGKGIIIFLDKTNVIEMYNKVLSFGPYTSATQNPRLGEYSCYMDVSMFKGDPRSLF